MATNNQRSDNRGQSDTRSSQGENRSENRGQQDSSRSDDRSSS